MKSSIHLNSIRVYAYHGCLPEEAVIGGHYSVDVSIHKDFSAAAASDDLSLTADYVRASEVVKEQMAIRSKLIETVAMRTVQALKAEFPGSGPITVRITKHNAPMPGQVDHVSVEVTH